MRASEFITEEKRGKPLKAQSAVSPGMVYTPDAWFGMYRAGVLMGRSPEDMSDLDPKSWITALPALVTYTDEERDMIKKAFKKMGIPFKEHMPKGSKEPDPINTKSPTQQFKGYPR